MGHPASPGDGGVVGGRRVSFDSSLSGGHFETWRKERSESESRAALMAYRFVRRAF